MTDVNTPAEEDQESSWKGSKLVGLGAITLLLGIATIYALATFIGQ